ncbi:hypothetical protein [Echinicola pacifica]|nr:hypothetical protein [Echinicola pacifica]
MMTELLQKRQEVLEPSNEANSLVQFYALGEHWRSDVAFYHDEIRFLQDLMESYFHHFLDQMNLAWAKRMERKISILDRRREEIERKLNLHLHHICDMIKDNDFRQEKHLLQDQEELENLLATYAKDFRTLKKQIFTLTENGLRNFQKNQD